MHLNLNTVKPYILLDQKQLAKQRQGWRARGDRPCSIRCTHQRTPAKRRVKHSHVDEYLATAKAEVLREHEWAKAHGNRENENAKSERKECNLLNQMPLKGQANAPSWLQDPPDMKKNIGRQHVVSRMSRWAP